MKIDKIVLFNIGPYIGENSFDFSVQKDKNIVLIGGKNGAGKTTFFKAIKTCLYGCMVWGFASNGREYYKIIDSIINSRSQYSDESKAFVEVSIVFDNGKEINRYCLHREWVKNLKGIKETFTITKNEQEIDEEEQADFTAYLLSIIPPDMFNFYFFDGESIADFFLGNDGDKNFRNAFLKLYGLDTLSLMVSSFEKYGKKTNALTSDFEKYSLAKKELECTEQECITQKNRIKELELQIDEEQVKLGALQNSYAKEGGVSFDEWKSINASMLKEESLREDLNRKIKEAANSELPFIILHAQLKKLMRRLEKEQSLQKNSSAKEVVSRISFAAKLEEYLNSSKIQIAPENLIKIICDSIDEECEKCDLLFEYSSSQMARLMNQIDQKLSCDSNVIIKMTRQLEASIGRTKKLRKTLLSSSVEGYGAFADKKEAIEKKIMELSVELERVKQTLIQEEYSLALKEADFNKEKANYEKMLKSKSISDLSSRAAVAYSILEEKLVSMQGKVLESEFLKCFKSIINKDDFIDGVVIDKKINIVPYKFVSVDLTQIDNYLIKDEKNHFLDLFEDKYVKEINDLRLGYVTNINLPSPIVAPFSKGERQVYIMSLYLALLKTSGKDIPFFIDTPFARIDSNHREKIVCEFFMGIDNQLFILSTDEEIIGHSKDLMSGKISDEFLLKSNQYGQTSILDNTYFGG